MVEQVLVRDQKEPEGSLRIFSQDGHGVMTFCFWLFSCRGRTHNVVATAVWATERCTHTPTCCTHIFLRTARSLRTSHTLMHVNTHAWLKSQVLVACACHISLSSHLLPSHVSPVLAPAVPWRSLRDHSRLRPRRPHWRSCPHDLAELSRPESAGQADSARGRAGWLSGQVVPNTGYETQKSWTRSLPWTMTRRPSRIWTTISPTSRKP